MKEGGKQPEEVAHAFVRQPSFAVRCAVSVISWRWVRFSDGRVHFRSEVRLTDVAAFVVVAVDGGPPTVVASHLNTIVTFTRRRLVVVPVGVTKRSGVDPHEAVVGGWSGKPDPEVSITVGAKITTNQISAQTQLRKDCN